MTTYTVGSGQTSSGITLSAGDTLDILSGGTASDTTVLSGGIINVESGGIDASATLSSGGVEDVFSGGLAIGTAVSSGGTEAVSSGGLAVSTTIEPVGFGNVYSGGTTVAAVVYGSLVVSFGGLDLSGTVASAFGPNAGSEDVYGSASATLVSGGGDSRQFVHSGGVTTSVRVIYATQYVLSGATADATTVGSGGYQFVFSGANVSATVVSSGAADTGTTVSFGGQQNVGGGGLALSMILSGGIENVSSGGTDSGAILLHGTQSISPGGLAIAATVVSGAHQDVYGSASGTVIESGGQQFVGSAGSPLGGSATSVVVSGGGVQLVAAGAAVTSTTIGSGGSAGVGGGATIQDTVIDGGMLYLDSGVNVSGGITFSKSGGTLIFESSQPPNSIGGFVSSDDMVDLTQLLFSGGTSVAFDSATDMLTVTEGAASASLQLTSADYTGMSWTAQSDGISGGTDVVPSPCFCRGTRILVERGETAVEELAIGDRVVTRSGAARPIRWIGRRAYDGRFVGGNPKILPIRLAPGAIADGVPARELLVSPEHALLFDGVLVAARLLVNGATIAEAEPVDRLEYFHIELDSHDIIFAEAVASETYIDCDNRGIFQNAAEFAALYPEDRRARRRFCAPRWEKAGPATEAIRAALRARAADLGYGLTKDPDLHLVVHGEVMEPLSAAGGLYTFAIPAGSRTVSLASRSAVPAEVDGRIADSRRLGVSVDHIVLRDSRLRIFVEHGYDGLCEGFYPDEGCHRWTSGWASLPPELLRPFKASFTIEVQLIEPDWGYPTLSPPAVADTARTGTLA